MIDIDIDEHTHDVSCAESGFLFEYREQTTHISRTYQFDYARF